MMNMKKFLLTAMLALFGGFLFDWIGIFLPWMLGPMFAVMVGKKFFRDLTWPYILRQLGLVVLGLQLGHSFTKEATANMFSHLPLMLAATILILMFSIAAALLTSKMVHINQNTALLGSIPGGMSQMLVLGEELKNVDETIVLLMQTIRVIMVIIIVPWFSTHFFHNAPSKAMLSGSSFFWIDYSFLKWVFLSLLTILFIWLGKKLHLPIPFLLGPILAAAVMNHLELGSPDIAKFWIDCGQLLLGAHLGYKTDFSEQKKLGKLIWLVLLLNAGLILFCTAGAYLLERKFHYSFLDMFLSVAPGGITEMAVTALSVHADVSIVTSFHLFRIFFILFLVAPLLKYMITKTGNQRDFKAKKSRFNE